MAIKDDVKSLILTVGINVFRISTGVCIGCYTFLDMVWCEEYDD